MRASDEPISAALARHLAWQQRLLEQTKARGSLGYPNSRQSCCHDNTQKGYPGGCPVCPADKSEVGTWRGAPRGRANSFKEEKLSWHMQRWLPLWAKLEEPRGSVDDRSWRCRHPLCTGHEPKRFP